MSKPRYHWWAYAKWIIRDYPAKCAELSVMRSQSCIAKYSSEPGSGESSRNTESIALRGFSGNKLKEYDAVVKAIDETKMLPNGKERIEMINLIYWRKSHNLERAALSVYQSYPTARRWHTDFVRCIGKNMGLLD